MNNKTTNEGANRPAVAAPAGDWNRLDIQALVSGCQVDQVFCKEQVDSTNDWAIRAVDSILPGQRVLFIARQQTAGRGRGKKQWQASAGSLTLTLALESPFPVQDQRRMLLPLAVGCGICDALDQRGVAVAIKWPNDIYVHDSKLGGVLVEAISSETTPATEKPATEKPATEKPATKLIAIGVGLNVNNDTRAIPAADSLVRRLGQPDRLTDVVIEVVNAILNRVDSIGTEAAALVERLNSRNWLRDRSVRWTQGSQEETGIAGDILEDGGLVIETTGGRKTLYSGSIWPLRNPDTDECRSFEN